MMELGGREECLEKADPVRAAALEDLRMVMEG